MPDELTDEQWHRMAELLAAALELSGAARRDYLDRVCADDVALRAELESLLAAHERAGLLDRPFAIAIDDASTITTGLVAGARIAQYEIEERLGAGGMGVVYRARDRRLGRTVALKFLPPALSADATAKRRFLTEARAAAALQHANVCTVHEIGETEEGQSFIAMAFVEGESLRHTLARGALPVRRAVDIAMQLAAALQCAHDHGVVHRDVKPANVMLGVDGVVKLVDFGVARLEESTVTGAGATPGTVAYMSPEQLRGEDVDHRADLWSLGVVLHEMLAGAHPFRGPSDVATMHAILNATPPRLRTARPEVPAALEGVVNHALARQRARRFQSAEEMREALRRALPDTDTPRVRPRRTRRFVASLAVAVVLLSVLGAAVGLPAWRRAAVDRARASLPSVERLADERRYVDAYELLIRAERALPGDTTVQRLMPTVADRITVVSHPETAEVWLRRVVDDGSLESDSVLAGVTPLRALRVPRADYRVDVRKEGFAPAARMASSALARAEASFGVPVDVTIELTLRERSAVPPGMIHVPGSSYALVGRGAPVHDSVRLADFFIDAHEVTNEQFREFVAAGGYADLRWWRHPIVLDGRVLSWREAMQRFVDRTGLPGPRGWSGQEFPSGEGRHPVTGVTWHEAAAYAAFVGKRLPTIYEWEKAARDGRYTHFEGMVVPWGLVEPSRGVERRANFGGRGTLPVGSHPAGISPFGAEDMAGNVEEWVANPSGEQRFVTGGGWDDPIYVFADYLRVSALHVSPSLGFRTALSTGANDATSGSDAREIQAGAETPAYRPVDDRTYRSLLRHYEYDHTPLDARVVERTTTRDWTRETIEIAGPWRDRTVAYLYLPNRAARPLQTIVFVPGSNTFYEATVTGEAERLLGPHIRAGRAVLTVLMRGMVGRPWDAGRTAPAPNSVQFRQEMVAHATELRRAVDYLETRADIDKQRLAYVAVSFGAGSRLGFLAVEPRFRSAVLIGGGFDERYVNALPEARNVNFAPHIGAPTLLLNGRYDEEHPWDRSGLPLWRLLPEPKRLALVEGGHIPPAESRVPVIEAWLDETLGSVR